MTGRKDISMESVLTMGWLEYSGIDREDGTRPAIEPPCRHIVAATALGVL